MADVAIAVRTYIAANAGVIALVGSRIYTDLIEQNATLPAIAFSKISTSHEHTLSNLAGLAHCRLQFDCYADHRTTANDIAAAVAASGIVGIKGTYTSVDIRGVRLEEGQRNSIEYARDDSDEHRYVTSFDLMIDYTETIT